MKLQLRRMASPSGPGFAITDDRGQIPDGLFELSVETVANEPTIVNAKFWLRNLDDRTEEPPIKP